MSNVAREVIWPDRSDILVRVVFLYVGQGDCTLVLAKDGGPLVRRTRRGRICQRDMPVAQSRPDSPRWIAIENVPESWACSPAQLS